MPMTDSEVIDAVLMFHVAVGSGTVLFDQKQRNRARYNLQRLSDDCMSEAPFWFRLANGTMATSAGVGSVSAPADFGYMGDQTQLYIPGRQAPLVPQDMDIIQGYRETAPRSGIPEIYAQFGMSGATGVPTFQLYPTPNGIYTIDVAQYVKRFPDIVDRPGPFSAAVGSAGAITGTGYQWKATFVTALGECEAGIASPVAGGVTLAAQQANLTNIPTSPVHRVTSRKIYRNQTPSGTTWKLVGTIADNVTTIFTDNIADGALGVNAPDVTTAITGMSQYTEDFHLTVFVEGLMGQMVPPAKKTWAADWLRTVKKRWAEHKQGQNNPQTLPPYGSVGGPVRNVSWRYRIPT